jgi:phospholipid/cholesterol/gamma-HCH transport system ATP-binding protein
MAATEIAPDISPTQVHPEAPAIRFENVSLGFEGKDVLENISFEVKRGDTRVLLGPAGVGKSVILKLANGLIKPDSGRIFVFGFEISAMREQDLYPLRECIGTVFQEGALFDSLTVRDNVGFRLTEDHVPEDEIDRRVTEALCFVELQQTIYKYPSELSGGMRRRVAIARAIVSRPSLLLYDSPTGGLDPITSTTIIDLVIKQRDAYRSSALLVTHRLQDAFMLASHRFNSATNRVDALPRNQTDAQTSFLVLHRGKLAFDGSTHDLVHSNDPFLKEYLS